MNRLLVLQVLASLMVVASALTFLGLRSSERTEADSRRARIEALKTEQQHLVTRIEQAEAGEADLDQVRAIRADFDNLKDDFELLFAAQERRKHMQSAAQIAIIIFSFAAMYCSLRLTQQAKRQNK